MINLDLQDQKQLFDLLVSLPILANERGREAILESASLEQLRPLVDLSGPPVIAVPLMVRFLRSFGRLDYEQEALGRFLSTIKGHVGIQEQAFLDSIITKYRLMTPMAKSRSRVNWVEPVTSKEVLERIIGENTLRPIAFLQQGLLASRPVAYIKVVSETEEWSGTGFMISPGLIITNHHVLPKWDLLSKTTFRFNYQLNFQGRPDVFKDYTALNGGLCYANEDLDYAIVELEGTPGNEWGSLTLKLQLPIPSSRVNIIQHPNGLPKQISVQSNYVKHASAIKIQYVTSTQPGSSGSPVFDNDWEVVGLHHAGGWLPEEEGGPLYFRNEGITIRAIVEDLPDGIKKQLKLSE